MRYAKGIAILASSVILAANLQAAIPASQRQALIALYASTGGGSWTNNSGWKTPPLDADGFAMPGTENTWFGVTTDVGNTTVTAINLATNNLVGPLPSEIGDFPDLAALNLRANELNGSLPSSIGSLTSLTLLHLGLNDFSGSVPTEIGNLTSLLQIDLDNNQFTGSLPSSLGNLSSLQSLTVTNNLFSGSLPPELGNLTNLMQLNCYNNQLSGSIPASFGGMTSLIGLFLHNNALTGSIPEELGDLSDLRVLYLSDNQLSGSIPASLGGLSSLEELELGQNTLSGDIPAELGDLSNLYNLHLQFNDLTGSIPAELGNLSNLVSIALQFNRLTGSIPPELGGLSALLELFLHANQLSGTIPAELGGLTNLQTLYLNDNELTGTIPAALGGLSSLVHLRLDENHLSGTIPPELGNLADLAYLYLGDNQLEGQIPSSLGGLTDLVYLYLRANKLTGAIPTSLTNLTGLIVDENITNIGCNGLYTTDPTVIAFLNEKDPDWASTQTVAPTGVTATAIDGANILVSWLPIAYTNHGGYYALSMSETSGGPYSSVGQTANKSVASLQVNGLTPGVTYYFVVRTHTDAHAGNQNAIDSGDSDEASATAWLQVQVRVAGTVTTGGAPLAGVLMSGLPGGPVTNSLGIYDVTLDAGWSGTVTPSLAGYTFDPTHRAYPALTADQLDQDYAATFVPPTISVISPDGGESWAAGTNHAVTWTSSGLTGTVTIDLYKGGVLQKTLGTPDAAAGTFAWDIATGETPGPDYRVLIWQGGISDDSNANFAITSAAVRKDDLVGTWDTQGVYYRNSDTGAWVKLASPATMITCGDIDNDGIDDLAGLWPAQGGIWVRYSSNGSWARLSSTARFIASGDMNGDGRADLLGTWDGQGVYYRNSATGAWVKMASEATMIAAGDIDGDAIDDLIGLWPTQGGIWVKYSHDNSWARLSSTARYIAAGDMNGDGRDDLLGTWDGQGVFYRNSITGAWIKMASDATMIKAGDIDGDATDDLVGLWPTQGGIWVKYSHNNAWALLSSTASDIATGKMRPATLQAAAGPAELELSLPMGGTAPGPEGAVDRRDHSSRGPGGRRFSFRDESISLPGADPERERDRSPGPGERFFVFEEQRNLIPVPAEKAADREASKKK